MIIIERNCINGGVATSRFGVGEVMHEQIEGLKSTREKGLGSLRAEAINKLNSSDFLFRSLCY